MNWIDKAVGYLSPEAGLRRARARAALTVVRSYEGAKIGRRTGGWTTAGSSANAEVTPSLTTLRNRSRDLVRNNPYAKRAIRVLTAKSIGTGIQARPDKGAAAAWAEFVDTCDFEGDKDFNGLQAMMAGGAYESGEVLIRRIRLREGRVPLQLQILEADYLDSTKFGPLPNGNYAIAGVEVDKLGRKQAYWMWDQHPGESNLIPRRFESKRVPASEVILFGEKERPGQVRFVPRLAVSMMRLRDLDDYLEAVIVRKKIEACFAAFVVGGSPDRPLGEAVNTTVTGADGTSTTQRQETLAPGMIYYQPNGVDVKFGTPSGTPNDGFTELELRAIAVGVGCTYEQITGDLSRVNYSSMRGGMVDFRDLVESWRWLDFIPNPMRGIQGWFLDAAWTAGSIRSPNYKFHWTPPAWPYVNPAEDIEAARDEVRAGMASLSEKIRERGFDPEVVFAEIEQERKDLAAKNIVVDSNAAVSTTPKVAVAPAPAADGNNPPQPKT